MLRMKYIWQYLLCCLLFVQAVEGQKKAIRWTADGQGYTKFTNGSIVRVDPKTEVETVLIKKEQLTPKGSTEGLVPQSYEWSNDNTKLLLFVHTAKVWRYATRGDYWLLDIGKNELKQLGKNLPAQSLMFAKVAPDGKNVAYVSGHNIYVEDIASGKSKKLTTDGSRKLINGTFDWVYEEEFGCRDGFRWCPDSRQIAYWQVDATKTRDFFMINNTDSVYSAIIPVEYPKVGESPSAVRVGVVSIAGGGTRWMKVEGDPRQHYIPRMEWSGFDELIVQQLDRKQQESKLIYCNVNDGSARTFWAESDDAWVDLNTDDPKGWNWVNKGQDFIWVSEKDGWRHIYKISRDGKSITLLTKGNYDIGSLLAIDEANNYIYFSASPADATQRYLYRVKINNLTKTSVPDPELVSNVSLKGTHQYTISPNAKIALHTFSNHNTPVATEWVGLPEHRSLNTSKSILKNIKTDNEINVEYLKITTIDNIVLDAWMHKPDHFDSTKKYPIVFYVYGEPAATTIDDEYGNHDNFLYDGSMASDGYIQVALDNRGTPSLKGAAWRKAIYRRNGQINIRDMAMGIKKLLDRPYIDKERVAVWGWSGGGSSTLHLLFQYPKLFTAGVSIAPVTNLLNYDNIYTERYMGLPQENMEDFIKGSALTYAKNLQSSLLLIHGTGDDNVHYSNAEQLINELIKQHKQFEVMTYPNRSHSIVEGEGTREHLSTLYTNFIRRVCPPGAK